MKIYAKKESNNDKRRLNVYDVLENYLNIPWQGSKTDWLTTDDGYRVKYTLSRERGNFTLRVYYDSETIPVDQFIDITKHVNSCPTAHVRSYFTGNNDYHGDHAEYIYQINIDIESKEKFDKTYLRNVIYDVLGIFAFDLKHSTYDSITFRTPYKSKLGDEADIEERLQSAVPDYIVKCEVDYAELYIKFKCNF